MVPGWKKSSVLIESGRCIGYKVARQLVCLWFDTDAEFFSLTDELVDAKENIQVCGVTVDTGNKSGCITSAIVRLISRFANRCIVVSLN